MTALVTGGSGFVGRYLVQALVASGRQVRCLVRSEQAAQAVGALGAQPWQGDVTDAASLAGVGAGVTEVFHLAAAGHVSAVSAEAYRHFVDLNVGGTRNLLRAVADAPLVRVVHFSSTAAMGLPRVPVVSEETPCVPVSPYQRSKRESEQAALAGFTELGLPVVVVRPCMIYGPGGQGEFLKICRLIRSGAFPRLTWGPELTPAVFVRDLVAGAIAAGECGRPGDVYLLTGPQSYDMHEMRRLILAALGEKRFYPYVPLPIALAGAWALETVARLRGRAPIVTRANLVSTAYDRVFDIGKARRELGYDPATPLAEGIAETVAWFRSQGMM